MRWIGLTILFSFVITTNNSIQKQEKDLGDHCSDFGSKLEEDAEFVRRGKRKSDILNQLDKLCDLIDEGQDLNHVKKLKWESMAPKRGRETFGKDQLSKEEFDAKLLQMLKLRSFGNSDTEMIEEYSRLDRKASFYFPFSYRNLVEGLSGVRKPKLSTDQYLKRMFDLIDDVLRYEAQECETLLSLDCFLDSSSMSQSGI